MKTVIGPCAGSRWRGVVDDVFQPVQSQNRTVRNQCSVVVPLQCFSECYWRRARSSIAPAEAVFDCANLAAFDCSYEVLPYGISPASIRP